MTLTVIAVSLSVLAAIALGGVVFAVIMFIGRDRSFSHPSIDEILARDDAFAQNVADRLADRVANSVATAVTARLPKADYR